MYYAHYIQDHLFLKKVGESKTIRFLNHPYQVKLLERHYRRDPLEVCSLNHFDIKNMHNPEYILGRMEEIPSDAGAGGWRKLEEPEACALVLGTCPPPTGKISDSFGLQTKTLECLCMHPLVRTGGAFVHGGVIPLSFLSLMIYIYDIRRFNDTSGMKSFFRLDNPNMLIRFFKQKQATTSTVRPSLMFAGWYCSPFRNLPEEMLCKVPQAFLFRDYFDLRRRYEAKYDGQEAQWMAKWRITVRFMNFIRMLWNTGVSGRAFDPGRFFRREDEVESFRAYINKLDLGLDNCCHGDINNIGEIP